MASTRDSETFGTEEVGPDPTLFVRELDGRRQHHSWFWAKSAREITVQPGIQAVDEDPGFDGWCFEWAFPR